MLNTLIMSLASCILMMSITETCPTAKYYNWWGNQKYLSCNDDLWDWAVKGWNWKNDECNDKYITGSDGTDDFKCSHPANDAVTRHYENIWLTACKIHDMCYKTNGRSVESCDGEFYGNMVAICNQRYDDNLIDRTGCNTAAGTWRTGVLLGQHRGGIDIDKCTREYGFEICTDTTAYSGSSATIKARIWWSNTYTYFYDLDDSEPLENENGCKWFSFSWCNDEWYYIDFITCSNDGMGIDSIKYYSTSQADYQYIYLFDGDTDDDDTCLEDGSHDLFWLDGDLNGNDECSRISIKLSDGTLFKSPDWISSTECDSSSYITIINHLIVAIYINAKQNILLFIFILITAILILIYLFCVCYHKYCQTGKERGYNPVIMDSDSDLEILNKN